MMADYALSYSLSFNVVAHSVNEAVSHADGLFEEPKTTNTVCSKIEETLGVINNVEKNNIDNKLSIGPNPANSELNFVNSSNEPISFSLINSIGQNILNFKVDSRTKKKINIKEFPSGIYMIYSGNFFAKKIIFK